MAAANRLRAVAPDEAAAQPKRQSVAKAAESGDRLSLLVSMRDRIAQAVSDPNCPPRDLASLTRRLQDIAKEIDMLGMSGSGVGSVVAQTDDEYFDASSV
jgi:hypothetical protein